jgi:hypothetical protein
MSYQRWRSDTARVIERQKRANDIQYIRDMLAEGIDRARDAATEAARQRDAAERGARQKRLERRGR